VIRRILPLALTAAIVAILLPGRLPDIVHHLGDLVDVTREVVRSAPADAPPTHLDGPYAVTQVIDGDTVLAHHVARGGQITIRALGIDSPQTHRRNTPAQCFGPQAAAYAAHALQRRTIYLEYDAAAGRHDRYGRTLAYLWVEAARLYNRAALTDGYAREYTGDPTRPYHRRPSFRAAEAAATSAGRGLWATETCAGDADHLRHAACNSELRTWLIRFRLATKSCKVRMKGAPMPADVESMFSVRQMPWHRQGRVLAEYPGSWQAARQFAGLDWDPTIEPVYGLDGVNPDGSPHYAAVHGWTRVTRSDTGATLSVIPASYTVIDHGDMGEIVEAVITQPNVRWETAGVLTGGRAVWCLALLDEPITLPADAGTATYPYMAITNRHDRGGACTLRATAVRIVCANTFHAAELEGDRTGATFAFRHTRHWRDRIAEARQAITGVRHQMRSYERLAHELLGIPVTVPQRERFITSFIPAPPDGLVTEQVRRNIETSRASLRSLFDSTTTAGIADTAYGLLQAAGEYLDHVRAARSWETRLGRTLIRPEPLKTRALSLIRTVVDHG
jgi:phage/plasmid-like protein (TIGR03299 family)